MRPSYAYRAVVAKVVDGDTIDFVVDLGFHVMAAIRTRLLGLNAPELSTEEGRALRDLLRTWYPVGTIVTIETAKDPGDKYGRWLARVAADVVPVDSNPQQLSTLNELLLERGLARPFP